MVSPHLKRGAPVFYPNKALERPEFYALQPDAMDGARAHLLLQTRTKVLNGKLYATFRHWYPRFRAEMPVLPAALRTDAWDPPVFGALVHASFNVSDRNAKILAILGPCIGAEGYELVGVSTLEPRAHLR
jgi:hypothetical protein